MNITLPWWLVVIIVLETLPMFVGPYMALTVPQFMGGPDATEINQAALIYTARNLAVGLAFILATYLRNAQMLFILILIRFITDLIDLPTFLYFDLAAHPYRVGAIFIFLYYIPALFALRYLWQQMHNAKA